MQTDRRIRVLVVEDSLTIRKYLCETLESSPEMEVVSSVGDGQAAIDACLKFKPDVLSLDMMLPVMTGLSVTEYLMAYAPTPILIVSASINRGELFRTYDALAAGAVDVLEKPAVTEPDSAWREKYLEALSIVSRVRVIKRHKPRQAPIVGRSQPRSGDRIQVVAIGASTGGPAAVVEVLKSLPRDFTQSIFLVVHLSEFFSTALAEWLESQTGLRVRFAVDGQSVGESRGVVTMAPASSHLEIQGRRIVLSDAPPRFSCRPSVDVLFESVAREFGPVACGCILTGMGRDGGAGLLAIRKSGGFTIAQDEATSVVFGMPREAILLDAAGVVLPLQEIGGAIGKLLQGDRNEVGPNPVGRR